LLGSCVVAFTVDTLDALEHPPPPPPAITRISDVVDPVSFVTNVPPPPPAEFAKLPGCCPTSIRNFCPFVKTKLPVIFAPKPPSYPPLPPAAPLASIVNVPSLGTVHN
jgi:hypothetical protein